jgi:putative flippase GtrA
MRVLWGQLWRFGLSGVAGLAVDVAVLYLALFAGFGYFLGRALSFLAAVWMTFTINRHFAFRGAASESLWRQWGHYLMAMLGGGAVNYGAYTLAIVYLPQQPLLGLYAVAIGSLCGALVNFISAKMLVFRH